ncbi:hypothetical protein BCN13_11915 [Salmonella enterica]|nr:hypothetical protein [Salmonella enterica]EAO7616156.1 hypothetical protein [Salmonella enterica]EAQ6816878.1 hypothetical protein [Salmonella enterica]
MRCCVKDLRRKSPGGVIAGLDHYRRCSQASRKGRAYDDCLARARQWALGQTTSTERKTKKKPDKRGKPLPGLF